MAVDLTQQALEASEAGIAEVIRLLQHPQDLSKLSELRLEYENRLKVNKAALSSVVQSQVEAARHGLELLDKSHRHTVKLKTCLDKIHQLCEECSQLIDHQDKIQLLSLTHGNIQKVLSEIEDIIDLPSRAEMVLQMLEDPANLLPAFEALTVLEGIAENAKQAWNRNIKAGKHDMSSMMQYLDRVKDVMADFEQRLWQALQEYDQLAQEQPTLLVDCLRVVELQERMDQQYARTKMESSPKRFKDRLMLMVERKIEGKFAPLLQLAKQCGVANKKVRYDQHGDLIIGEKRDYLGNLVGIVRINPMTGKKQVLADEEELRGVDVIEEEIFDEQAFLDELLDSLYEMESNLAIAYDCVTPCFPPHYAIFEVLFQLYHVHLTSVIHIIGHRASSLSVKGALRVMEFVRKYMETARGFGIEEDLVRLPIAPQSQPGDRPGLDLLMESYIQRMETTVTAWYNNILLVDLKTEPKPGPNGCLYTPGCTEFFRILNEEIQVIQSIDDHGDVMFQTAQCALRVMSGFQAAQSAIIAEQPLTFEMFCALLNNNVTCHDQSLEFAEEAQELLEPSFHGRLEIEAVCRGFLDVAKLAMRRAVEAMFNDPGMSSQLTALYSSPDWLAGTTTATLLATINDYMNDVKSFVEPSFVKRVAEAALSELVRRAIYMFAIGIPQVTSAMVRRMESDEDAMAGFFEQYLKMERMHVHLQHLADVRDLVSSQDVATLVAAYTNILTVHSGFGMEALQKTFACRTDLPRAEEKAALAQAKDVWKRHTSVVAKASAAEDSSKGSSWFSWGSKKPPVQQKADAGQAAAAAAAAAVAAGARAAGPAAPPAVAAAAAAAAAAEAKEPKAAAPAPSAAASSAPASKTKPLPRPPRKK